MADVEFPLPKYARVVTELRRRIEEGVYSPGEMLPSEAQLVREFGIGRTTIVRALQILQHDGWISGPGLPRSVPSATEEGNQHETSSLGRPSYRLTHCRKTTVSSSVPIRFAT
jgi:GntR family transcriptional regulator